MHAKDNVVHSRRRRRRMFPPEILDRIEDLHKVEGRMPGQIHQTIEREFRDETNRPTLRTVKDIVAELGPRPDPSGAWLLQYAPTRELPHVVDALRAVVTETGGRRTFISQNEASLLASICEAVPGITGWRAFDLARRFADAEPTWEATAILHHYLAFRPWESEAAQAVYDHAAKQGWIGKLAQSGTERYETAADVVSALDDEADRVRVARALGLDPGQFASPKPIEGDRR